MLSAYSPLRTEDRTPSLPVLYTDKDPIPEALHDVLHSPSLFGKILLIAECRSPETGQYDGGFAGQFNTPEIERALRRLHLEIFTTWLGLSLQRQKADMRIFLNANRALPRHMSKIKDVLASAQRSLPPDIKPHERQLFLQDLRIVQALFKYDQ